MRVFSVNSLPFRLPALSRDLVLVLSLRLWQAAAGLLTTVLAVHFLSPETQGWYYSFMSVAALYTIFDLGLSVTLVQVAAHGSSRLNWRADGRVEGDTAPWFRALVGSAVRWYAGIALLFAIVIGPGGMLFFGQRATSTEHWFLPWLTLCGFTAAGLLVTPFLSILEGSGQIARVYGLRLALAMCGSILCWFMLAFGAGLWATAMVPAMTLLIPLFWLMRYQRGLLAAATHRAKQDFDWRREVWPLQWRLGISLLCGYLLTQINIPILFHTQGAVVAGQLGLSLTIANTLGLVAQSWITRRIPLMARAVAERNWVLLDTLFMRDFVASSGVFMLMALCVLGSTLLLSHTQYVKRVLPLWQLTGLLVVVFSNQLIGGLAVHLRSHRREPFAAPLTISAFITVPLVVWAAAHYSSAGLVTVLVLSNVLVNLPIAFFLWRRCNRIWRQTS